MSELSSAAAAGAKIGGSAGAGNRIGGFSEFAIEVYNSSATVIEGNFIGLDVPGVRALGGQVGIVGVGLRESTDSNLTIRSNKIAGVRAGIAIVGNKVTGATVTDNVVGLRFDGSGTLPTGVDASYAKFGIRVDGSPNVQVLRNFVTGADMNLLIAGNHNWITFHARTRMAMACATLRRKFCSIPRKIPPRRTTNFPMSAE